MSHSRVLLRALALSLALTGACAAQSPAPAPAPVQPAPAGTTDAAAAALAAAKANERAQQVTAALAKSDELIRAGKIAAAISLLQDTDQKIPGDARIASGIGTAFELAGNNPEALNWIREGIKRNASEHAASEWLHARIVEARIALAKDPEWFAKNSVLGLDFGRDAVPVAPEILPIEQGRIKGADQLLGQIDYQLTERTRDRQPPDPVLGDLYASAADLAIAGAVSPLDDRKSKLRPEAYYERALQYGAPHAGLIRQRLARYRADLAALPPAPKDDVADYPVAGSRFEKAPAEPNRAWIYIVAAALFVGALIVVGTLIDRRRRRLAEATPPPPLPDVD